MNRKKLAGKRSSCPVASTLDVVGDKWSLLLVRDVGMFGKHRNKDFQDADERIPSNILATRLKHLVAKGILEKRLYQERPPRYEYHLTPRGRELMPVLEELAKWGMNHVRDAAIPKAGGNE